jgi:preprotein translocase subunit SecF
VDSVVATVGHQLEKQATLATLYSMLGMLVYLWFRFQLIYGVAAVVACFHDTLITVGAFALTGKESRLTVIAAILTLVGYSMNDTIVVFDRIRENLRLSRREPLARPGESQHQPDPEPDRAHLGPHLSHRAFAVHLRRRGAERLLVCLVVGILIGTYSSIAVAAPMLVAWQEWRAGKGKAPHFRRPESQRAESNGREARFLPGSILRGESLLTGICGGSARAGFRGISGH